MRRLHDRRLGTMSRLAYREIVCHNSDTFRRLQLQEELIGHSGCVNTLSWKSDGGGLLSGSDDTRVILWDMSEEYIPTIGTVIETGHTMNIFCAKFLPWNEHQIVSCSRDAQIRTSDLTTGEVVDVLKIHDEAVKRVCVNVESPKVLISCSEDGTVKQVDSRDSCRRGTTLVEWEECIFSAAQAAYRPEYIALGGDMPYAWLIDVRKAGPGVSPIRKYPNPRGIRYHRMTAVDISEDATLIAGSWLNHKVFTFKAEDGSVINSYKGHINRHTIKDVTLIGKSHVASGSDKREFLIWDIETGEEIFIGKEADEMVVNCVECHPLYPVVASSGISASVKIWAPTMGPDADRGRDRDLYMRDVEDSSGSDSDLPILRIAHLQRFRDMFHASIGLRDTDDGIWEEFDAEMEINEEFGDQEIYDDEDDEEDEEAG